MFNITKMNFSWTIHHKDVDDLYSVGILLNDKLINTSKFDSEEKALEFYKHYCQIATEVLSHALPMMYADALNNSITID